MADIPLHEILAHTYGGSDENRTRAEALLKSAYENNRTAFLVALITELADVSKDPDVRQSAGTNFKNALGALTKDEAELAGRYQNWLNVEVEARAHIKGESHDKVRSAAAQALAQIALIEVPPSPGARNGHWPDLIEGTLLSHMAPGVPDIVKQATLETLGYICEKIDPHVIETQANAIVAAIMQGMSKDQPNEDLRHAALNALLNCLDFLPNFHQDTDRDHIMMTIGTATQSPDRRCRITAFQCLVQMIEPYYQYLTAYIQAILNVSVSAIQAYNNAYPFANPAQREELEPVGLQAINFWSTIAERETAILDAEAEGHPTEPYRGFTLGAIKHILVDLCTALLKQDDDEENDDPEAWDIAMAAGTCIRLMSVAVGDEIVPLLMPFIQANISHAQWRNRDAAVIAFGSIMEGTQLAVMPAIIDNMPILLDRMGDESILVRDSVAWTLGNIVKFHQEIVDGNNVGVLIQRMVGCLSQEPRVVRHVCWVLQNIAEAFSVDDDTPSSGLSPYFKPMLDALMATVQRPNEDGFSFRLNAYEALNTLVSAATQDCYPYVQEVFPLFFTELCQSLNEHPIGADDIAELQEKQSLLVSTLFTITKKLPEEAAQRSDQLMTLYINLYNTNNPSVQEEVLLSIGLLGAAVGPRFEIYLDALLPLLSGAVNNWQAAETCAVAVGVIADLYRSLNKKLVGITDDIIRTLLFILQQKHLSRELKPVILVAFGDIAGGIEGEYFTRYFKAVMDVLQLACNAKVDPSDRELVDYLNGLRYAIIAAWTGILHGMHATNNEKEFLHYLPNCVSWLATIYYEAGGSLRSDNVTRMLCGVLGDLAHVLKKDAAATLRADNILGLLQKEMSNPNEKIANDASWAYTEIGTLPY